MSLIPSNTSSWVELTTPVFRPTNRRRYFEYLAYHDLMQKYFDEDPNFRWEQAPRPRLGEASYKQGYFDDITIEERLSRTAALDFVTTEHEPLFDAADVFFASTA